MKSSPLNRRRPATAGAEFADMTVAHNTINIASGTMVRLTKVRQAERPSVRAGNWNTYVPGGVDNTASLPVDYEILGILLERPSRGGKVKILRFDRNGVSVLGVFESTPVVAVSGDEFTTINSVYRLEAYEPPLIDN